MKNDSSGTGFAIVMVLSFFLIIGLIVDAMEPKCIKIGCDNPRADGSCYCYFHKGSTYDHTYKYSGSSSSGNKKSTFPQVVLRVRQQLITIHQKARKLLQVQVDWIHMMQDMMISIWMVIMIMTGMIQMMTMRLAQMMRMEDAWEEYGEDW